MWLFSHPRCSTRHGVAAMIEAFLSALRSSASSPKNSPRCLRATSPTCAAQNHKVDLQALVNTCSHTSKTCKTHPGWLCGWRFPGEGAPLRR